MMGALAQTASKIFSSWTVRYSSERLPCCDTLSFGSAAGHFQDSTLDKTRPQDHLSCPFGSFCIDIITCTTSAQVLRGVHREQINFQQTRARSSNTQFIVIN